MKKITFILALAISSLLSGQVSSDVAPRSWQMQLKSLPTKVTLPTVDVAKLQAEDLINDQELYKPFRFGEKIDVDYNLFNAGLWTELENGDRIWRLNLKSNGARTMNLLFDLYSLPEGAELYLYNNDRTDKIGPYTSNENQEDGVLGSWIIYGDDLWVEYYEPSDVRGLGRVSIDQVVHGYRGFGVEEDDFLKFNRSGDCNVDVMCNPNTGTTRDWTTIRDDYRHAVARIIINGAGFCTGTLVNNVAQDATPYFLTANHCMGGVADGSSSSYNASNWAFGFDWYTNTPDCATTANTVGNSSPTRVLSGASLRANSGASDVALFELNITPPTSWNLYYAGWSRAATAANGVISLQHPSGDIMKMARYDSFVSAISVSGVSCWNVPNWNYGVTEGGSSGGSLVDFNGHIVGQLLGGSAACVGTVDNGGRDFYGRLDVSWTGTTVSRRLSDWLDPNSTSSVTLDGVYANTLSEEVVHQPLDVQLFPNPTKDVFRVSGTANAAYQIYNLAGQLILNGEITDAQQTISLGTQANGVYFVQLQSGDRTVTQKIIKE